MNARHKDHGGEQFGLVPLHLDYGGTAPFIYLTLSALNLLGSEGPTYRTTRSGRGRSESAEPSAATPSAELQSVERA
jgi:hypothetical protein